MEILGSLSGTIGATYSSSESKAESTAFVMHVGYIYFSGSREFEWVDRIGGYMLPNFVSLQFDKEEETNVYCVESKELHLVSCGDSFEEAKAGLEGELEDAFHLYLGIYGGETLESNAEEYRKILDEIKRLNSF